MTEVNTLIIGASAAGLSCAAQLAKRSIPFEIIEKESTVGNAWRNHYDRLHLHTNKSSSNLPFISYPKNVGKYPSRSEVVAYIENYCKLQGINPSFNTPALKVSKENGSWKTKTPNREIDSQNLIVCTGNTNVPNKITKPGLDSFPGRIIHSAQYKNGEEFSSQKVLVIGFGNSACEIAICLYEHGAMPALSVRSPVNVIPRDILGIPVLKLGILMSGLPPKLADTLNKPLMDILVGDIEKLGLKKLPYGPMEQIAKHRSVPLLDIGTMGLIKQGNIQVFGDIISVHDSQIQFDDNKESFDAIVMATGYHTGLEQFMNLSSERLEDIKRKIIKRRYFGSENLYFCGFFVSPSGMLREIKLESEQIANKIQQQM